MLGVGCWAFWLIDDIAFCVLCIFVLCILCVLCFLCWRCVCCVLCVVLVLYVLRFFRVDAICVVYLCRDVGYPLEVGMT